MIKIELSQVSLSAHFNNMCSFLRVYRANDHWAVITRVHTRVSDHITETFYEGFLMDHNKKREPFISRESPLGDMFALGKIKVFHNFVLLPNEWVSFDGVYTKVGKIIIRNQLRSAIYLNSLNTLPMTKITNLYRCITTMDFEINENVELGLGIDIGYRSGFALLNIPKHGTLPFG